MKTMLTVLILTLVPAIAGAQTPPPFAAAFDAIAANLSDAAAAMPGDKFSYRPVAEVRSFGQILAHVTGAHYLYCSQASGTMMPPEVLKQLGALRPVLGCAHRSQGARLRQGGALGLAGAIDRVLQDRL